MKCWIILIVLFHLKLGNAYYCDSRAILRRRTYEEMLLCQNENSNGFPGFFNSQLYNNYDEDYESDNTGLTDCNSHIPDFLDSIICTIVLSKNNESLNFEGPNLRTIKFENSIIATVPSNFFLNNPSLENIYINHCHVNDIDMEAFKGLENLEALYLKNNYITEIKKGIFNSLKNLTILDIASNQIKTIEKESFEGMLRLQKLNISHNKIQHFSKDIFVANFYSLHTLDLSHNIILTFELSAAISHLFLPINNLDVSFNKLTSFNFSQLTTHLFEINLDNNNLNTLDGLMSSTSIETLKLSNNRLSKFHYASINTKYLNLSDNILQDLKIFCSNNCKIHTLDVSQNLIENFLPNTFDNMSALYKLYLNNNKLTSLPIGLFKNLKKLQILGLSRNRLSNFQFGTFSGLTNLLGLDISGNLFTNLDYKTFHVLNKLTVLNIANNELTTLNPYHIINYCKNLQMIILDGNSWNCESLLNFTTILQHNHVQIVEGSNNYVQNHLGHPCFDSYVTTENPSTIIDNRHLENEINNLRKLFEFEFRNSSFYNFFQNYKNHPATSQRNFSALNDYFNNGFENSSFFRYLNQNITITLPKIYNESLHNLTDTLNLLNLKLSDVNETNLINSALQKASEINLKNYNKVLSNFSHNLDSQFKSSNFYKLLEKNFTNLNTLNRSTLKLLNNNLEKFSNSVENISSYFESESSFHKLFQQRLENGSLAHGVLNEVSKRTPEALTSNVRYEKLTNVSDLNHDIAQQVASLRGSFIAFMAILITILLIAMLVPVFKKFRNFCTTGKSNIGSSESIPDFPLT